MIGTAAKYALHVADHHTHELGFLPQDAYARSEAAGRLKLLTIDGEEAGYLMLGPLLPVTKVYQTWVEEPVRLLDHARSLILDLAAAGAAAGVERLSLHCAVDLEANHFWHQLGFERTAVRESTTRYRRPANRWELVLPRGLELEEYLHIQAPKQKQKELLRMFGMEQQFRAAHTSRFRKSR